MYTIEKATNADIPTIQELVNCYAKKELMLPRSLQSLYENLRSFWICRNKDGKVIGCCALQIVWADLAEIRSTAVATAYRKRNIGKMLVEACLNEARQLKITQVFLLTFIPEYFRKFGFKKISKQKLPHKIWSDCIHCPHFPDCNETAMICRIRK